MHAIAGISCSAVLTDGSFFLLMGSFFFGCSAVLIDGIDLKTVGLATLRNRVSIIPQVPCLLPAWVALCTVWHRRIATAHFARRGSHSGFARIDAKRGKGF